MKGMNLSSACIFILSVILASYQSFGNIVEFTITESTYLPIQTQSGEPEIRTISGPTNQVCSGVNIHFTTGNEKDLDMIVAGGFRFIRTDLIWEKIERAKGNYNWEEYDELTAK